MDRNPSPPDCSKVIHAGVGELIFAGFEATAVVTKKKYPPLPRNLLHTPDVESLLKRYEGFLKGNEPLLSMAYFCLTVIESIANYRADAGKIYGIEKGVLDMLGTLTSEHGDKSEARKAKGRSSFAALTEFEKTWIIATVKLLIRRKAEYDYDSTASHPLISINSLPRLK